MLPRYPDNSLISIHALREEDDRYGIMDTTAATVFLSTPSVRRTTF